MSKRSSLLPRALTALTVICTLASAAWAQPAPTVRIRGTIEAVDGSLLTVKSRDGAEMKVRMTDNAVVVGVTAIAMSEIKPGSYIGVTAIISSRRPSAARARASGPGICVPTRP